MIRRFSFLVSVWVIVADVSEAWQFGWNASIVGRGNYITTSKLFFNPDAATDNLRSQYFTVDDMFGAGLELRLRLGDENILLILSADYISRIRDETQFLAIAGTLRRFPGTEGLRFIPMEIGINTYVPLGSEDVRLTMGGGVGAYYAVRTFTVAGVGVRVSNNPIGYGIHVGTGIEYRLNSLVTLRGEMKFRDPEVVNESSFEQETTVFNGSVVPLPRNSFRTKIQVDGLSLSFGVMVELF